MQQKKMVKLNCSWLIKEQFFNNQSNFCYVNAKNNFFFINFKVNIFSF